MLNVILRVFTMYKIFFVELEMCCLSTIDVAETETYAQTLIKHI